MVVRAVLDQPRPDQSPLVLYRQDTQYDVAPPGVDVTVDLQLRIAQEPLAELELTLSPSLTLISAQRGDQDIPWTVGTNSNRELRRIQLRFPTPLEPGQTGIRLKAVTRRNPRKLTRLPRIHPIGLLWQEEMATVNVHLPLEVLRIETNDCRQFQMAPFSGQTSGETTRFQFFDRDGYVQVQIGRRRTGISTASGTSFLFGVRTSTAEQQTILSAEGGDRFQFRGQLHSPWSLDSLTLTPPELLDDWQAINTTDETRELLIRLREPLVVGQTAKLTLRGRGPRVDLEGTVDDSQLTFVEFPEYDQRRSLITARGIAPNRLQNRGVGTSRPLNWDTLDSETRDLLTTTSEIVYDVTDAETRPSFVLKSSDPVYHADVQVRVVARESQVEETLVIDCQPSDGELRRLLVFLWPATTARRMEVG